MKRAFFVDLPSKAAGSSLCARSLRSVATSATHSPSRSPSRLNCSLAGPSTPSVAAHVSAARSCASSGTEAAASSSTSTSTSASASTSAAHPYSHHRHASHPSWTLSRAEAIDEHAAHAALYVHKRTGAQLLSVVCSETEKVFGAALRTVPTDDTGVAHILEHSVLCGSSRYPSKEPFVELLKSSLQTYLNAMTYPDRTVYPVASPNVADFHNLVRVYMDAVFAPRLSPWVLQQEGHHVTPAGLDQQQQQQGQGQGQGQGHDEEVQQQEGKGPAPTSGGPPPLAYKGVVFNEMKGVYSSGDSLHAQACEAALFPDTAYALSSGGDPRAIPRLTYEHFTQFHASNYAPSRVRLFFFGDDPEGDRLAIAAEALEAAVPGGTARATGEAAEDEWSGVGAGPAQPATSQLGLGVQQPFAEPATVHEPYPAGGGGGGGEVGEGEGGGDAAPAAAETDEFVVDFSLGPTGGLVPAADSKGAAAAAAAAAASPSAGLPLSATEAVPGVPDEHFVTVNWCLTGGVFGAPEGAPSAAAPLDEVGAAHALSSADRLGLHLLSHLLMGTQAATLRKALTDAGIGSAVTGGGLDDGVLQPVFSAGLKGVKASDVAKVEPLVLHVLTMAAGQGFDADHIAASLNTLEFNLREFASGGSPRGLALFLGAAPGWLYGRDPFGELRYEEALREVKAELACAAAGERGGAAGAGGGAAGGVQGGGSSYFQALLRKYLLLNPHRATVHSYPDPRWSASRDAAEKKELEAMGEALAKEAVAQPPKGAGGGAEGGLERVSRRARALLARQATPDPPEALAAIPSLKLSDLGREQAWIPSKMGAAWPVATASSEASAAAGAAPLLTHEQPTAGIGYASLHFDISHLPPRLLPYMPLFSWCMTSTGTRSMEEVALSRALGAATGGVRAGVSAVELPGRPHAVVPRLTLSGKALAGQGHRLGELMAEIATGARLDARERIAHALRETVSRHEAGLVGAGHRYASGLVTSALSTQGWLSEQWGGLTALLIARSLLRAAGPEVPSSPQSQSSSSSSTSSSSSSSSSPVSERGTSQEAWRAAYAELGETSSLTRAGAPFFAAPSDALFMPPANFDEIVAALEEIRARVLTRSALQSAVATGDAPSLEAVHGAIGKVLSSIPAGASPSTSAGGADMTKNGAGWAWGWDRTAATLYPAIRAYASDAQSAQEALAALRPSSSASSASFSSGGSKKKAAGGGVAVGMVAPSAQVNFVTKGASVAHVYAPSASAAGAPSSSLPGGAEVASSLLRNGYLWERVRVQGGAYGGFASLNRHSATLSFASYRDPHIARTLGVFDGSAAHLEALASGGSSPSRGSSGEGSAGDAKDELRKAVLSTVGSMDAPMAPAERGDVAAARWAMGLRREDLQRRRDEVLGASVADLRDFARAAASVAASGAVAVVGSERSFAAVAAAAASASASAAQTLPKFVLLRPL